MKRKTGIKRFLALLLTFAMAFGVMPLSALADESSTAKHVSVRVLTLADPDSAQKSISVLMGRTEINVDSFDVSQSPYKLSESLNNAEPTVLHAFIKAQEALYGIFDDSNPASNYMAMSSQGFISKAFGFDTTVGFTYLVNGIATNVANKVPIHDGDDIEFIFYKWDNTNNYYTHFDRKKADLNAGDSLTLTLSGAEMSSYMNGSFDSENKFPKPTEKGISNATILIGNSEIQLSEASATNYKTNNSGQVTMTFAKPGKYYVSALSKGSDVFVMPCCEVTVAEGDASANTNAVTTDAEALKIDGITGGEIVDSPAAVTDETLNLPLFGASGTAISWKSSNEDYISSTGKVTRPLSGTQAVTLTATIERGHAKTEKKFYLTVSTYNTEEASKRLDTLIEKLNFYKPTPVFGKDSNIITVVTARLKELGYPDVNVSVESSDRTDIIALDGTITYLKDLENVNSTKLSMNRSAVIFKLSIGSVEKTWKQGSNGYIGIGWDIDAVKQMIEATEMSLVNWDSIKGENESQNAVTKTFTLPYQVTRTDGKTRLSNISWTSSNPALVSLEQGSELFAPYTATVTKPVDKDTEVTLTGTYHFIYDGSSLGSLEISHTQEIKIIVKAIDESEKAVIREGLTQKLTAYSTDTLVDVTSRKPITADVNGNGITWDFAFPTSSNGGYAVKPKSPVTGKVYAIFTPENTDIIKINGYRAEVYRPLPNEQAINTSVTVTLYQDGVTVSKSLPIKIAPLTEAELSKETQLISEIKASIFDGIKNANKYPDKIRTDLRPFAEVGYNAEGKLDWRYGTNWQDTGFKPVVVEFVEGDLGDNEYTFKSSAIDIVKHSNLLVTRPEAQTNVTVTTCLSSVRYARYAEKYPDDSRFKPINRQRIDIPMTVLSASDTSTDPDTGGEDIAPVPSLKELNLSFKSDLSEPINFGFKASTLKYSILSDTDSTRLYFSGAAKESDATVTYYWLNSSTKQWTKLTGNNRSITWGCLQIKADVTSGSTTTTYYANISCRPKLNTMVTSAKTYTSDELLDSNKTAMTALINQYDFLTNEQKEIINKDNEITTDFVKDLSNKLSTAIFNVFVGKKYPDNSVIGAIAKGEDGKYALPLDKDKINLTKESPSSRTYIPKWTSSDTNTVSISESDYGDTANIVHPNLGGKDVTLTLTLYDKNDPTIVIGSKHYVLSVEGKISQPGVDIINGIAKALPQAVLGENSLSAVTSNLNKVTSVSKDGDSYNWNSSSAQATVAWDLSEADGIIADDFTINSVDEAAIVKLKATVTSISHPDYSVPVVMLLSIPAKGSAKPADTDKTAEWPIFRGNNNGLTNAKTARNASEVSEAWTYALGSDYSIMTSNLILAKDAVFVAVNDKLIKLSKSGQKLGEVALSKKIYYNAYIAYGDGKVFVPYSEGVVEAIDADTMQSLWTSKSVAAEHDMFSPLYYSEGRLYASTAKGWAPSEGYFYCIDTANGKTIWKQLNDKTGYYWAGATRLNSFVLIGDDSGFLASYDAETGRLIDRYKADASIRSSVAIFGDKAYFTTVSGMLCAIPVGNDGKFNTSAFKAEKIAKEASRTTSTPVVLNGRAYIGATLANDKGVIGVLNAETLEPIFAAETVAGSQSSPLITTAYGEKAYVYMTYNKTPGGITVLEDFAGNTTPISSDLYTPKEENYCNSSIIADNNGNLYYKNDSNTIISLKTQEVKNSSIITFAVTPDSAKVEIKDAGSNIIAPTAGKTYALKDGVYTYTVKAEGYADKSGGFTVVGENQTITVALTKNQDPKPVNKITAYLTVDLSTLSGGTPYKKVKTEFTEGATVYDLLIQVIGKDNLSVKGSGKTLYIASMRLNNTWYSEFDNGKLSGWMYKVNNKYPQKSCYEYTLSNGQEVVWAYTKDGGDDINAGESSVSHSGGNKPVETAVKAENGAVTTNIKGILSDKKIAVADISGKAFADAIKNAKTGTVAEINIDLPNGAEGIKAQMPKEAVDALKKLEKPELKFTSAMTDIAFDEAAAKTIIESTASGALSLEVNKISKENMTADIQKIVGSMPVYEFKVTAGNSKVSEFNGSVTVSIPYTLKAGENPDKLSVYYLTDKNGIEKMNSAKYDSTKKCIVFTTTHFSKFAVAYDKYVFKDVSGWAQDSIYYLANLEVVKGVSDSSFAPNSSITRAEFVTILARMSGEDLTKYKDCPFNDVKSSDWYCAAVTWAKEMGIVSGYNGGFKPMTKITRQDMAVMLVGYADKYAADALKSKNEASAFADKSLIASYAAQAVGKMQTAGIVTGKDGNKFAPRDNATRAETAKMIAVFLQNKGN